MPLAPCHGLVLYATCLISWLLHLLPQLTRYVIRLDAADAIEEQVDSEDKNCTGMLQRAAQEGCNVLAATSHAVYYPHLDSPQGGLPCKHALQDDTGAP